MNNLGSLFMLNRFLNTLSLAIVFIILTSCTDREKAWVPGWKQSAEMTVARAGAAIVTRNNVIYIIGGVDGKDFLRSIESAEIKADGSLSQWKVISELPEARGFMSAVIHESRLYVVGGGNGKFGKNLLNTIVSAEILGDKSIGEWREEKQRLLLPRRCSKLFVQNGRLYALGGFGGALLDSVEISTFATDGTLGKWQMAANKLTMPRYVNSVSQSDEYVFILGGHHPVKGVGVASVEYAHLRNKTPLKWQETDAMAVARYAFSSFYYNNNVYAAGGISGTEYLNSIEFSSVASESQNTNISLKWEETSNLPLSMANFTTIVVKGRVYLVGGSSRDSYNRSVWYSGFKENGQLGYWGSKEELNSLRLLNSRARGGNNLVNAGTVIKNIQTEGYTYLLVTKNGQQHWLAAPKMQIKNNTRIQYSEGVYMSNFYSKSLKQTFKSIIFVGTVEVSGGQVLSGK